LKRSRLPILGPLAGVVALASALLGTPTRAPAQGFKTPDSTLVRATGSSVSRSLADHFGDIYNVKDFGARGDCSTSSSLAAAERVAVQRAIAAAGVRGGTVDFPNVSGCYMFDSALTVTADNVFLRGNGSRLEWLSSYTGHGIEFKNTSVAGHTFNVGLSGFRLEPQAAGMTAVIYTLRLYGFTARDLRIDGPGSGAATGAAILMDWGTSAGSDYSTGHRIENVYVIGYRNAIQAVDPHAELVTDSVIHGNFLYCEAQASSVAIADVYDGSVVSDNEIEGCAYGIKLSSSTGQGTSILGNRFEANPTADLYIGSSVYNVYSAGNHHASGSGGNVFQDSTAQRQNYITDGTLGYVVQAQPLTDSAARSGQTAEPRSRWYNFAESASPLWTQQLFGASGGTNAAGETVGTRELDLFAGDALMKLGTTGNRSVALYVNSLPTLTLARGTGENTLTTDANTLRYISAVADSGTAVAHAFDTSVALGTSGAKIASFRKAGSELAYVDKNGLVMGANLQAGSSGGNTVTAGTHTSNGLLILKGNVASNGTSIPLKFLNSTALTTSGDVVGCFYADTTGTTQQLCVDKDGIILLPQAANSVASPGAATANVAGGRAAIASGASSVTITNSLVTATSRVFVEIQFTDATCTSKKSVVPSSGSFVVNMNANCTSNTAFAWEVHK
jgi:hypothetical protein